MSLSAGEQQVLNSIESGLAGSDPGLASLLATFARLASGEEMPVHEEIRVPGRRATRRPLRNRRPRRGNVRRDGRSLRLGWQQTILLLWLAVTIAMVAVALVLNRGSGNGPCPEAWAAAVCTGQAPAHSPRPTAHHTVPGQVLLTDAIIWLTPTRRTVHEGRGDPNRLGRGQGLRRGALPHPGLCELLPAACRNGRRAPRRCRSSSATAGPSTIHLPRSGRN